MVLLSQEMVTNALSDARDARILGATMRCAARWGVSKTTVDDIAREAGCSRATIYRTFPAGKDALLAAAARQDIEAFFERLAGRLDSTTSLEDMLVTGTVDAARWVRGHEVFQYLLDHEPDVVLPHLAFRRLDGLFAFVTVQAAPFLRRFLGEADARRTAEWVTRLLLSYTLVPSADLDLCDEADTRRLVRGYLLPSLTTGS